LVTLVTDERRVVNGSDPATREGKLLEELDALEFEVGEE